ncbi:MAG TPA: thiamine phosphate synthase [Mucilaginibacter sp.]
METTFNISGGIYLVLNPAMDRELLMTRLSGALAGGIDVVQIWNNWPAGTDRLKLIEDIALLCRPYQIPVLINNDWQLMIASPHLHGVHFDNIPDDFAAIKQAVGKPFLAGITCSNHTGNAYWAMAHGLDYISFCSMFPSSSAASCDIVMPATVKQVRAESSIPIFVAGGITPQNIPALKKETPFDGVAVISGILSDDNPEQKVKLYKTALNS